MVGARERLKNIATSWDNVSVHEHRFGGIEFRMGRRELGHLHGESLLDIPFPRALRDELVSAGKVQKHHILPESGWISFLIHSPEDVEQAVSLLHRSYEAAVNSENRKSRNNLLSMREENTQ